MLTPYPWYIEPSIHGILTPLPMVYQTPYPWYFDPPTHGILTPLSMVYWTPYPWYFDNPTHGILTTLPISWLEMRGVKIPWGFNLPYKGAGQFSIRGVNIPWIKIDPRVKIPYDTGSNFVSQKKIKNRNNKNIGLKSYSGLSNSYEIVTNALFGCLLRSPCYIDRFFRKE
jgi:hypothetical protein